MSTSIQPTDACILAIESSCDETSAAVYCHAQSLLVQETHSQVVMHAEYGGVVPELAARSHLEKLYTVIEAALAKAQKSLSSVDAIAYTRGPGLVGPLLIGASYADALSFALNKPLIPVHHLEAHITIPMHAFADLDFPFLALLVSGGHTELIYANDLGEYQLLGSTLDDAAGEAFDKCGKIMGIDYPAGPQLADMADAYQGNQLPDLPEPLKGRKTMDFSFSGLKTAFSRQFSLHHDRFQRSAFAYAVQQVIVNSLVTRLRYACQKVPDVPIVVAGGVAANRALRVAVRALCQSLDRHVYFPDLIYCTDNAAMVAHQAFLQWRRFGVPTADLDQKVAPRWPLG